MKRENLNYYGKNRRPSKTITLDLTPQIKQKFLQRGFTINQHNTSISYDESQFYDYVEAYEKMNSKCTVVANPDCGSSSADGPFLSTLSVICTDAYEKNKAVQEPIAKSLDITGNIIEISKTSENYAYLDIHGRRAGYYMIARHVGDTWEKLIAGQDLPLCSEVNRYNIPFSLINTCYQNDKEVTNTNK